MKNLVIALSLLFAVGASAQVKKTAPKVAQATPSVTVAPVKLSDEAKAQKNVADLNAFTPLSEDMKVQLLGLFNTKFQMYKDNGGEELSAQRKAAIARIIDKKLEASLDGNTYTAVKANKPLFDSLVQD